ncbi:MAG TPA: glycosyltransferase [Polyangiaceae bacterium]|nr:glycosyltransferase [Polyangiaceae bacterium]
MAQRGTRKSLRALYLQPAPLFGGAERQAALTALLLPQFGIDVVPLVGPGPVAADWLREFGVKGIVQTPHFPGGWRKQRGLSRLTLPGRYLHTGWRARAQMAELALQHEVDLVLASLPFAWITGSLVARHAGIPIVWRAGGSYLHPAQKVALWGLTRFQRPDLLLCNSLSVKEVFSPFVPAPVEVVPNGVHREVFHPGAGDASRYRPRGADLVVGCAMRLADAKRPEDFVALAERLRASYPGVRFLLAGEGSRRAALQQFARESGLNNLEFLGFVSDMPSFYAACDVLVLPSRSEGCPNYLLEAAAMGKPVVAAAIAPVIELLRVTEHGLLFELGDVAGLTQAVSQLLSNADGRCTLGERALRNIDQFSASASAATLADILRALVAEHAARRGPSRAPRLPSSRSGSGLAKAAAE